ncbi:MAG: DM13 domain-containing protein [Planctomycetales bacterium]|nr:DM13 domain-containing protein [Planctomycetales bacterium]
MPSHAGVMSPMVGWQAELNTFAHDVTGTVTILDEDTVVVEDFTYDGQGLAVYFYLATEDTKDAFIDGLSIGPPLLGTLYKGNEGPLVIDLPDGETLDGYHAISVWCVPAQARFGSGTFMPVPEPTSLGLLLAGTGCLAVRRRRGILSAR